MTDDDDDDKEQQKTPPDTTPGLLAAFAHPIKFATAAGQSLAESATETSWVNRTVFYTAVAVLLFGAPFSFPLLVSVATFDLKVYIGARIFDAATSAMQQSQDRGRPNFVDRAWQSRPWGPGGNGFGFGGGGKGPDPNEPLPTDPEAEANRYESDLVAYGHEMAQYQQDLKDWRGGGPFRRNGDKPEKPEKPREPGWYRKYRNPSSSQSQATSQTSTPSQASAHSAAPSASRSTASPQHAVQRTVDTVNRAAAGMTATQVSNAAMVLERGRSPMVQALRDATGQDLKGIAAFIESNPNAPEAKAIAAAVLQADADAHAGKNAEVQVGALAVAADAVANVVESSTGVHVEIDDRPAAGLASSVTTNSTGMSAAGAAGIFQSIVSSLSSGRSAGVGATQAQTVSAGHAAGL